jgi:hypothetical protein
MSYWGVYVEGSGTSWDWDYDLQRPNDNLETNKSTNCTRVKLADGSSGFYTPETKSYKEVMNMIFLMVPEATITKIDYYLDNNVKVKIVTHTGEEFTGKFVSRNRVWLSGVGPDEYDIQVGFQPYV